MCTGYLALQSVCIAVPQVLHRAAYLAATELHARGGIDKCKSGRATSGKGKQGSRIARAKADEVSACVEKAQ